MDILQIQFISNYIIIILFNIPDTFSSDFVTLMQIDCEVINTSMLHVREKSIPENLKNNQRSTEKTPKTNSEHHANQTYNKNNITDTKTQNKTYKPYFIDKRNVKTKLNNGNFDSTNFKP